MEVSHPELASGQDAFAIISTSEGSLRQGRLTNHHNIITPPAKVLPKGDLSNIKVKSWKNHLSIK
ncbi:BAR domain-containing protein [Microscilla marina]|uniref:Uncharacterized protein n=1 Tax=Microscilla marina ATCC 23134 TaxID=313606 RepID=A1ZTK3_MICM2|nr:hypothetical protein [Microscilla marina]EAY26263.1 hypothetical protein M23134_01586 [Microscilla marina ATCC 23134]EAY26264.1 hypothetical protein M23134_01587 [Microscilla marina ATCC 23134]